MYISNAFSLQMLSLEKGFNLRVEPISKEEIKNFNLVSAIGHADTAAVVSEQLGVTLPMQRISLKLQSGESLIVAQLMGGRLPEGSTNLPEGFSISYVKVTVE